MRSPFEHRTFYRMVLSPTKVAKEDHGRGLRGMKPSRRSYMSYQLLTPHWNGVSSLGPFMPLVLQVEPANGVGK